MQEVMKEWVLKVGDANVKQKNTDTKHTESVALSVKEPVHQPVGSNYIVISDPESRQTHT